MSQNKKPKWKKSKGQVVTSDFMLAIIILMIVIGMAGSLWNRSMYLIAEKNKRTQMRRLGLAVSSMLVKSSGVPNDWDSDNVITIGLVDRPNVLNEDKILAFNSMEKSKIQDLLGIESFDFSFRVRAVNDTILFDYGTYPSGEIDVIVVRRLALYDTEPVYVEFGLWRA